MYHATVCVWSTAVGCRQRSDENIIMPILDLASRVGLVCLTSFSITGLNQSIPHHEHYVHRANYTSTPAEAHDPNSNFSELGQVIQGSIDICCLSSHMGQTPCSVWCSTIYQPLVAVTKCSKRWARSSRLRQTSFLEWISSRLKSSGVSEASHAVYTVVPHRQKELTRYQRLQALTIRQSAHAVLAHCYQQDQQQQQQQ